MPPKKDITGQTFGHLTALYEAPPYVSLKGNRISRWHCKCDCGNEVDVKLSSLTSGQVTHCGCRWNKTIRAFGKRLKDVYTPDSKWVGKQHGYLTILSAAEPLEKDGHKRAQWKVHCSLCGKNHIMLLKAFKVHIDCGCSKAGNLPLVETAVCQRCGAPLLARKTCNLYCEKCREEIKNRKKYSIVNTCLENVTVQDVVDYYMCHKSVASVTKHFGFSGNVAKKILIAEGALHDNFSDKVKELLEQGKSRKKIAEILGVSLSTICYYTPYEHEIKFYCTKK